MSKVSRTIAPIGVLAAALAAAPAFALNTQDIEGTPVASSVPADRAVVLDPSTRWVNVAYGETIKFVAGGQAQEFRFDGLGERVPLSDVIPGAQSSANVYVNQANNPLFDNSGGDGSGS